MSGINNALAVIENDREGCLQYEELLLKRDQLFRECGSIMTSFTKEFGDMITANFELKIDCIKKKKTISYCRRRMNRGLAIDTARMNEEIVKEMKLYYNQLKEMLDDNKRAKEAGTISEFRLSRTRKIYRRLTKTLHPDINRRTMENENLRELWERIASAYQKTDVEELENLEVLVRKAMEKLGDGSFELNLDDIDARIERVENQINEMLTTEPYTYLEILENEDKKQAYKDQLQAEHDDYEQYLESLTKTLDEMLHEEGVTLVWKMN